jgi:hypothetical protein
VWVDVEDATTAVFEGVIVNVTLGVAVETVVLVGLMVLVLVNVEPGSGVFVDVALGSTTVLLGVAVTVKVGVAVGTVVFVVLKVSVMVEVRLNVGLMALCW